MDGFCFVRGLVIQDQHGDVVAASEVSLALDAEILEAEEFQVLVEALVVVPVGAFDLAIVAGRPRADQLVGYPKAGAKLIEGMYLGAGLLGGVRILETIVGLDYFGHVAEEVEGLEKEGDGVAGRCLVEPFEEAFSVGLVDDGVLEEPLVLRGEGGFAGSGDELGVHLPFFTDGLGGIVLLGFVGDQGFLLVGEALDEDPVEAGRAAGVAFGAFEADPDFQVGIVRVLPPHVRDPFELHGGVGVRVRGLGPVGAVHEGFACPVETPEPPPEAGPADVVAADDNRDVLAGL